MRANSEWFGDYVEAEHAADRIAGDNPGLIVWLIEAWDSQHRFEDGCDGELYVLSAKSVRDGIHHANENFNYWTEQYDATREPA